jgi:hypothetical protein
MSVPSGQFKSRCMILCVLALVSSCSHQARRVNCDGRLEPINTPTPIAGTKSPNGNGREP